MRCSRVYRYWRNQEPNGAEHRYSKVQAHSNRLKKGTSGHSNFGMSLDVHLRDVTLALRAIRSSVTHSSPIHGRLLVRLIVRVAWSGRHRSRTLGHALSDVSLVECAGEGSFLTSTCHWWQVRGRIVMQGVVRGRSVGTGR